MAAEMKYGDYISGGWGIVKANLVPCIVLVLIMVVLGMVPLGGLLNPLLMVNFMAQVKAAKKDGKPMDIGGFFNFENAVDKLVGPIIIGFVAGLASICLVIPMFIVMGVFCFLMPILADKPGTPFMNAIKGSMAWGKQNIIPGTLLVIVTMLVAFVGVLACGLGTFITLPIANAALYLAYEDHKSSVEAAAAGEGVQL